MYVSCEAFFFTEVIRNQATFFAVRFLKFPKEDNSLEESMRRSLPLLIELESISVRVCANTENIPPASPWILISVSTNFPSRRVVSGEWDQPTLPTSHMVTERRVGLVHSAHPKSSSVQKKERLFITSFAVQVDDILPSERERAHRARLLLYPFLFQFLHFDCDIKAWGYAIFWMIFTRRCP